MAQFIYLSIYYAPQETYITASLYVAAAETWRCYWGTFPSNQASIELVKFFTTPMRFKDFFSGGGVFFVGWEPSRGT